MMEKISINSTKSEYLRMVFPEHANSLGTLYGGFMMRWILDAGILLATKFTKGPCVIGSMDSIDFINPVKIGDTVRIISFVEYVGNTSLEIGLNVLSGKYGEEKLACTSHLSFVAFEEEGKKKKISLKVYPETEEEQKIYDNAIERRKRRKKRIKKWKEKFPEFELISPQWATRTQRIVFPEDTLYLGRVYGGKLLMIMDELCAILARKYTKGTCVTASLDEMDFFAPAYVGEILHLQAAISAVFKTSLEIFVKVFAENPEKGEIRNVLNSFMVFVHIDKKGNPKKVAPLFYHELWEQAIKRKEMRNKRRKEIFHTEIIKDA